VLSVHVAVLTLSFPHSQQRTAVGCGLVAWDVVLSADDEVVYSGVGGTVGNVLSILSFLGWRSVPIVRLGADNAGLKVLEDLLSAGVDTTAISLDKSLRTPVVYQTREPVQGHHAFSFKCPRCGLSRRYSPASLHGLVAPNEVTLRRGDVFFYDRVTPDVVSLAERARLNGAITVFEPSSLECDAGLLGRALRSARVVKYSSDRLGPAALEALDAGFVEIQTLGARGLRFRMRSLDPSWVELPALSGVSVVDAAGAGDWCTAGFLYMLGSLAEQAAPSELGYNRVHAALRVGQFLAAMNCATVGARGLMRAVDASQLRTRLQAFVGLDDELQTVGDFLGGSVPELLSCFSGHAWGGARSGPCNAPALCDCAVGCSGGSAGPRRSGTACGPIH
jgi:fructokinase